MRVAKLLTALFFLISFSHQANAFWFNIPHISDSIISFGDVSREKLNPDSIKVLVWNVYKGKHESWRNDFLFLTQDKDILILQEALMDNQMFDVFDSHSDFEYHMGTSFIYKKEFRRTGVATASKVKARNVKNEITKKREWLGGTPKALLFSEYKVENNKNLLVINIHALNSVPAWVFYSNLVQASDEIKGHDGPIIFAGDFNAWSSLKVKLMYKFMKKYKFKEVKFPNGDERMKAKITNKVLDFIFIKGLSYSDSYVWGSIQGADHKAMEVELRID